MGIFSLLQNERRYKMYKTIIVGIYLIHNKVNNKNYIGQSKNILSRWTTHRADSKTKNSPLYYAIRKYGLENFEFSILEECEIEELPLREDYYIDKYNAYVPYGYNINKPETHYTNLSIPQKYKNIIKELKNTNKTYIKIGEEFGLSAEQISRINYGIAWRIQGQKYPIRKGYNDYDKEKIIPLLKEGYKIKEIAFILGVTEATVQGYMQTNNIRTSDFRKRLTSNKITKQYDLNHNLIKTYNSIKEAAEEFSKSHPEVQYNTILCGIKRRLNTDKPYKNFYWGN